MENKTEKKIGFGIGDMVVFGKENKFGTVSSILSPKHKKRILVRCEIGYKSFYPKDLRHYPTAKNVTLSYQLSIVETFPKGEKEVCITVGGNTVSIPEKEVSKFFADIIALKDKMETEIKTTRTGVGQYKLEPANANIEFKVYP